MTDETESLEKNQQDLALGSKKPIQTLFGLSLGPFVTNLVNSAYGFIETFYFSKAFGDSSLAVLGAVFPMAIITGLLPPYLIAGYGVQLGYLFGQNRSRDVAQLYVDHLRIAILISVFFAVMVFFATEPLCILLGASPELAKKGKEYYAPFGYGSIFSLIMQLTCNLYLTLGKTNVYGAAQFGYALMNQGIVAPIMLFVLKTPIWGSQLSTAITNAIFALVLTIPIFSKKSDYQPSLGMFFKPFLPETRKAFIIGIPTLLDVMARLCTPLLVQAYLFSSAQRKGNYNEVLMIWGVNNKIQIAVMLLSYTFTASYIPSASYALGANNGIRMLRLTYHSIWISCACTIITAGTFIVFVRQISSIWSKDSLFLNAASEILPVFHYTIWLQGFQTIAQTMVIVMQLPIRASIMSVFSYGIPILLFSTLMYKIKNNSPAYIIYAYNLTDIWSTFFSFLCIINPIKLKLNGANAREIFKND